MMEHIRELAQQVHLTNQQLKRARAKMDALVEELSQPEEQEETAFTDAPEVPQRKPATP